MKRPRPSSQTQKGTPYGVGVGVHVDETGIAEKDVIGKEVGEVGNSGGISHSPPLTILMCFTVAGFRPLPSQVYIYIQQMGGFCMAHPLYCKLQDRVGSNDVFK